MIKLDGKDTKFKARAFTSKGMSEKEKYDFFYSPKKLKEIWEKMEEARIPPIPCYVGVFDDKPFIIYKAGGFLNIRNI